MFSQLRSTSFKPFLYYNEDYVIPTKKKNPFVNLQNFTKCLCYKGKNEDVAVFEQVQCYKENISDAYAKQLVNGFIRMCLPNEKLCGNDFDKVIMVMQYIDQLDYSQKKPLGLYAFLYQINERKEEQYLYIIKQALKQMNYCRLPLSKLWVFVYWSLRLTYHCESSFIEALALILKKIQQTKTKQVPAYIMKLQICLQRVITSLYVDLLKQPSLYVKFVKLLYQFNYLHDINKFIEHIIQLGKTNLKIV
ncbi:P43 [Adoxophyes orana nucleopolyhedrovirus]|uniref:P43 n=1 Tax=Adoxophyes orana nucleopolyhedrovirus TaxID=542343 RepID=UPI0001829C25|nr:P43 [Adoxophyes orana nucleopolyhedrovirus]ACF05378.1 P43 [Adoxophyes orana nucleopolyhedrovirus]